ncbi:MAG: 2-polyprenyl-3-methyl-6-methoxy-1,4-benzoquinone monooxygenase, partial [Azonexus sp.]
ALRSAADEETEHLAWTEQRIVELGGRKSLLNPLWYAGALSMGLVAGRFGDRWNLGFLAETERQVEAHLDSHLRHLPEQDLRSREVVEQMRIDEIRHAETAVKLGAAELPEVVKRAMKLVAGIMTGTAYRV